MSGAQRQTLQGGLHLTPMVAFWAYLKDPRPEDLRRHGSGRARRWRV